MISLPGYDRWLTTPPEDQYDGPLCPKCEVELDKDNTCACGEYCVDCCPDCEPVKTCTSCGQKLTVEVPACECGKDHCIFCHENLENDTCPIQQDPSILDDIDDGLDLDGEPFGAKG